MKTKPHLSVVPQSDTSEPAYPLAVSLNEATKIVGLSRTTLWKLTASGEIPSVKVGNRKLIIVEDLRAWLMEQRDKQAC